MRQVLPTSNDLLSVFDCPKQTHILQVSSFNRQLLRLAAGSDHQVVVFDGFSASFVRGHSLGVRVDGGNALEMENEGVKSEIMRPGSTDICSRYWCGVRP